MKKGISLVFVFMLILACVGVAACSGGGTEAPTPAASPTPSSSETNGQAEAVATPASTGSGFTWNDIPVYGGAKQLQEMNWSIPPAEGDYTEVEWRYYETNDSPASVLAYYKSNMPGNGWGEHEGWMEMPELTMGIYSKNNEKDSAIIWIAAEEGKTVFALMRASQ